jgi:hypothetical protein
MSYFYKEINRTEPSPSVRVPWKGKKLGFCVLDIVAVVTLERVKRAVNRRFGSGGGRRCRRRRRRGGLFLRRRTVALVELPTSVVRLFVRRAVGLGAQRIADEELGGVDGGGGSTLTF